MSKEELKSAIQNLSDQTDQSVVFKLREKLKYFDVNNPDNKEIIDLAIVKGLI